MYNCKLPAHFKNQTMHKHPFRKITVLAGICCILLSACKKAEYYQLSQEEQDEWSTYGANQSFNFISTQGNLIPYKSGGLYRAYHQSGDLYEEYLYTAINRTDTSIESNVGGVFIDKKASGKGKEFSKVIKMVKNPSGSYAFKEEVVHNDHIKDFLKEK